ncbi:putative membrane lipoprotein [Gottschalkia acidurici 9a]|uniref:Membrane lipoprotein n=1 Tax=Gottschalkia acidurici (strain ATCC 7906 / DSM 604 / BCRC 14475 / CIP 104303 / KCTC 5404 / NCIMB 10678 / 9a) TaxID=1128398 RepID=K0B4B9_GOTA9|nr:hypothetical protein [Gottschalkia acidurici]AFS79780.1 putative membrane lipoprotein [Gottschalkia acidurici 9a]
MKLNKIKKGIPIGVITGVLILSGCQSTEAVRKNVLMTEQTSFQNTLNSQSITKERAKEIAIKLFENYFDEEVDVKNLFEKVELLKIGDEYNFKNKNHWSISWSTFDRSRLKNVKNMTKDEVKKLNEDWHNNKTYHVKMEEKNGEIIEIGIIDEKARNQNMAIEELKAKEIETEDAKNIALDYIKKNKLVDNIEGLEFLGDIRISPDLCTIAYKYGENKVIEVFVESLSRKVTGFGYVDEQQAKDAIEINKDYKTKGILG